MLLVSCLFFLPRPGCARFAPRPDPILQGYLQITTGLFAFVFAAVAFVRFQGTQDRISLILGSGFLLSGATLTASSILFFQLIHESQFWYLWAPVAWWISRLLLALLFVSRCLSNIFFHARANLGWRLRALFSRSFSTYLITVSLRRLPPDISHQPRRVYSQSAASGYRAYLSRGPDGFRRRRYLSDSAFDRSIYSRSG